MARWCLLGLIGLAVTGIATAQVQLAGAEVQATAASSRPVERESGDQ